MIAEQLEARGVRSSAVLEAFRRVPREMFMAPGAARHAYDDAAFPIDCGQTISQPYMVACMTESLSLTRRDRVLEIGAGSGYQTAILAQLAGRVYAIEWQLPLMAQAAERLEQLGLANVTFRCGDGSLGWEEHAPFDAILVAAGAPSAPHPLCEQLVDGGRLVVPVGDEYEQSLLRIIRRGDEWHRTIGVRCRFVRLVGRYGWRED